MCGIRCSNSLSISIVSAINTCDSNEVSGSVSAMGCKPITRGEGAVAALVGAHLRRPAVDDRREAAGYFGVSGERGEWCLLRADREQHGVGRGQAAQHLAFAAEIEVVGNGEVRARLAGLG